ncbi:hypothetical protein [Lichenifustis flavocetrariae]|uniref:Uncharacterized protein n=1 Tax=Lichenifustis flavocetrariae TaxID=2949735 RepID=A0AA41Z0W6_9HYPH|nr:hypothetical protein [Lichenifustis flavocetrariae]MCW6512156.1 hypothetical protein [Lichenifustis flavocetrariae]
MHLDPLVLSRLPFLRVISGIAVPIRFGTNTSCCRWVFLGKVRVDLGYY